jgi:hypothetical protein
VSTDRYIKGIEVGITVDIVGEAMCPDLGVASADRGAIADRDDTANIKEVVAHEADGLADFQGRGPAVVGYAIKAVEVGDVSVVADLEGFEVADEVLPWQMRTRSAMATIIVLIYFKVDDIQR